MNILGTMRETAGYTLGQVAEYLGMTKPVCLEYERRIIDTVPYQVLEKLAALYHVEEYDILMGTAVPHSLSGIPAHEKELIPFFTLVENYLKMSRILDGADRYNPNYRINW